jgi:hypothetical protein
MTRPKIPFAALRQFLLDLGFQMKVVPGSQVVFLHAGSVAPRHLAATSVMLDAKGLLDRDEFDEFVRLHSAGERFAGRPPGV